MNKSGLFKLNIIFVYLFILLLSGAVSFFVYQTGSDISRVNQQLTEKQLPLLNNISQLKHWLNEHERILYEHYATQDKEKNLPKLIDARENIDINISRLSLEFPKNEHLVQLKQLIQTISMSANKIILVLDRSGNKWDKVRELLASVSIMGRSAQPLIDNMTDIIQNQISESNSRSNAQLSTMSSWVGIFSFSVLLIAVLVGFYIVQMIKSNFEKRRLALFIEKSPNAIASVGWDGEVKSENVSWRKSVSNKQHHLFFSELIHKLLELKQSKQSMLQWRVNESDEFLEVTIHQVVNLDQVMVFVENISDRVAAQEELEFLAYNDPITGLPNMKKLEIDLEIELDKGNNNKFYLFTIGMKQLKFVTTTHGISVSDVLIKALVERIQKLLKPLKDNYNICELYRFTGAKFNLLLADPISFDDQNRMIHILNRCLISSMEKPLLTLFGSFFLDFQTGCVRHPEHGYNAALLIKNANAALSESQKTNQKNIVMFDHEISYREQNWYRLENDLRAANLDKELFLTYQPKFDLATKEVVAMEALVRWQHPAKGLISPVEFIPIAEESGLIATIGTWVLHQACRQTKIWHEQGKDQLQVAVNVSPSQLLDANFVEGVMSCLDLYQLSAEYLEIEITEEVLATDQETCVAVLNQISAAGISIAVDDFGTGYSSLSYLNKFPLSKLKIDRSFITNIDKNRNKNNLAIVTAIISLSQSLGIKVIAEGIETENEMAVLQHLNCDQGQGYLFDKPLSADEFYKRYISFTTA